MSEKTRKEKTRISVTVTEPYVEALDDLVERGIYLTRGEIVLEALRHFFKDYGIEPFCTEVDKTPKSSVGDFIVE